MRRGILVLMLMLAAAPLWADFGLSNVVTKEIHRASPVLPPTMTAVAVCHKEVYYPYTIHISSWQQVEDVMREMETARLDPEGTFVTKIDLGSSGLWHRLDYGLFASIKTAVLRLRELQEGGMIDKGACG